MVNTHISFWLHSVVCYRALVEVRCVGIMSLMDTLLSMQLAEITSPLNAPPSNRDALLFRSGQPGKLLQLIEVLETNDMEVVSHLLDELAPFDVTRVNTAQVEALAWANSIAQEIRLPDRVSNSPLLGFSSAEQHIHGHKVDLHPQCVGLKLL
jgi:hypothetical protein